MTPKFIARFKCLRAVLRKIQNFWYITPSWLVRS